MENKSFYKKLQLLKSFAKKHKKAANLGVFLLAGAPLFSALAGINAQTGMDGIMELPLYKQDNAKNCKIILTDEKIAQNSQVSKKGVSFVNCLANCNCSAIDCNCQAYNTNNQNIPCNCHCGWNTFCYTHGSVCDHQCNCMANCVKLGGGNFECNCVTNCQNPNL